MGRSDTVVALSSTLGWTYFSAWSLSFYPQIWMNYQRKSVVGLSFDYQAYNLLGYTCYSIFTCCLSFNPSIRHQYDRAFDSNLVTIQDCVFALHAVLVTLVTLWQVAVYDRGDQRFSWICIGTIGFLVTISLAYAVAAMAGTAPGVEIRGVPLFSWLWWVYWLSFIKLGITVIKYVPQAKLNYDRKSTVGWNIYNVLLDFTGGLLSVAQLLLDGATEGWSGVVGDPIKFCLGFVSIVFDILFMFQHYVLYTDRKDPYDRSSDLRPDSESLIENWLFISK